MTHTTILASIKDTCSIWEIGGKDGIEVSHIDGNDVYLNVPYLHSPVKVTRDEIEELTILND